MAPAAVVVLGGGAAGAAGGGGGVCKGWEPGTDPCDKEEEEEEEELWVLLAVVPEEAVVPELALEMALKKEGTDCRMGVTNSPKAWGVG